jgi:hypothetical protein
LFDQLRCQLPNFLLPRKHTREQDGVSALRCQELRDAGLL